MHILRGSGVPGVGELLSLALLAQLPELGTLSTAGRSPRWSAWPPSTATAALRARDGCGGRGGSAPGWSGAVSRGSRYAPFCTWEHWSPAEFNPALCRRVWVVRDFYQRLLAAGRR